MNLLIACFLTCLIEGGFFCCFRSTRNWKFLTASVGVNVLTNLSLNLFLRFLIYHYDYELVLNSLSVFGLESFVVVWEFVMYGLLFGFSKRLLLLVFLANLISYLFSYLLLFFPVS